MARFGFSEGDNYAPKSSGGYLNLKNDQDVAIVRFMYEGPDDIEGYMIHEVKIDGKTRDVNCLKESYNSPDSECPFCASHIPAKRKYYIPVYDCDTNEVKIWKRSHQYVGKRIFPLTSEVHPLCSQEFKITRHGVVGDKQTDYTIYPVRSEELTMSDLPEVPTILGSKYLLDKNEYEMNYYIDNGYFPSDEEPTQMSGGRASNYDEPIRRRTPANSSRRDVY